MQSNDAARSHFDGVIRVIRFNWPMYATALGIVLICAVLPVLTHLPAEWRAASWLLAFLVVIQTMASLIASHWVYDLSPLKDWQWLQRAVNGQAHRIVNVHSGYDETSGALVKLFPDSEILVVDLYPALKKREPSIVRARTLYPPQTPPICTTISAWPLPDTSIDLILIAFAAHEIREPAAREQLFRQAQSSIRSDGRIVLVEHLRDLPNFVAFGPGFLHFVCESEWRRCSNLSGLKILRSYKITPLVGVFILCP